MIVGALIFDREEVLSMGDVGSIEIEADGMSN